MASNEINVTDSIWFTNKSGTIGMVIVETKFGWKSYIGSAEGYNQKTDEQEIAGYGVRLDRDIAIAAFKYLEKEKCAH